MRPSSFVVTSALILVASCASTAPPPAADETTQTVEAKPAPAPVAEAPPDCPLPAADKLFLDELMTLWSRTLSRDLKREIGTLPTMLFTNATCVFVVGKQSTEADGVLLPTTLSFAGTNYSIRSRRHEGQLTLPDGAVVPVGIQSFSKHAADKTFFVLSLMSEWRQHPAAGKMPNAAEMVLGVGLHELVHTVQLPSLARALENVVEEDSSIDDDIVQDTFAKDASYVAAYRKEADALWAAVLTDDATVRTTQAKEAVALAKARRAKWFVGPNAFLSSVEPLMLNLEGVGEWTRTMMLVNSADVPANQALEDQEPLFQGWKQVQTMSRREIVELVRGQTSRKWVQESGLALLLLVDALVPDWRSEVLNDPPGDLYAMLERVLSSTEKK